MRASYRFFYYLCPKCEHEFDALKEVGDRHLPTRCRHCEHKCTQADEVHKKITTQKAKNYSIIGAKVESAEYNPGLGTVVKNRRHKEDLCKRQGVVEIGNDFGSPDKIHKRDDADVAYRREENWRKALDD